MIGVCPGKMVFIVLFLLSVLFMQLPPAFGSCDCNSEDMMKPCSGRSIEIKINNTIAQNQGSKDEVVFIWQFKSGDQDALCGQFANKDYWIAPAIGESGVTITAINGTGDISADIDPEMESLGLLPGVKTYGNYIESENIVPELPLTISGIASVSGCREEE